MMREDVIATVSTIVLAPLALAIAAVGSYLLLLTVAALAPRGKVRAIGARRRRFAILVPAHNESSVIARLLVSLTALRYPAEGFAVFVVADNCTDDTAAVARRSGAAVFERTDEKLRAKGHALRWLMERIPERTSFDAYVVFDADSVADPDFLARMDDALENGGRVLQSHYRVLNASASPVSALREAAFASLHYLRPRGRLALGLSVGLKGNGMCFDARTLDRIGWSRAGLAEDVELHLTLVRAGIRTDFVPSAVVRADMPTTLRDATSQNMRWEAGRLGALRVDVPAIARDAIRTRDFMLFDAAAEQIIPPVSVAAAVGTATAAVAFVSGATAVAVIATLGTAAVAAHFVSGLIAVRAPARAYVALLAAPPYVMWKVTLYIRALFTSGELGWVRTRRVTDVPDNPGGA